MYTQDSNAQPAPELDIGFVHPGQEVEIKVETFTQYGVVHGTVQSVSNDAIEDENSASYTARASS